MSILKVTRLGHPVLRKVTEHVPQPELQSLAMQKFIDDMIETMKEYEGVGLAADQSRSRSPSWKWQITPATRRNRECRSRYW